MAVTEAVARPPRNGTRCLRSSAEAEPTRAAPQRGQSEPPSQAKPNRGVCGLDATPRWCWPAAACPAPAFVATPQRMVCVDGGSSCRGSTSQAVNSNSKTFGEVYYAHQRGVAGGVAQRRGSMNFALRVCSDDGGMTIAQRAAPRGRRTKAANGQANSPHRSRCATPSSGVCEPLLPSARQPEPLAVPHFGQEEAEALERTVPTLAKQLVLAQQQQPQKQSEQTDQPEQPTSDDTHGVSANAFECSARGYDTPPPRQHDSSVPMTPPAFQRERSTGSGTRACGRLCRSCQSNDRCAGDADLQRGHNCRPASATPAMTRAGTNQVYEAWNGAGAERVACKVPLTLSSLARNLVSNCTDASLLQEHRNCKPHISSTDDGLVAMELWQLRQLQRLQLEIMAEINKRQRRLKGHRYGHFGRAASGAQRPASAGGVQKACRGNTPRRDLT